MYSCFSKAVWTEACTKRRPFHGVSSPTCHHSLWLWQQAEEEDYKVSGDSTWPFFAWRRARTKTASEQQQARLWHCWAPEAAWRLGRSLRWRLEERGRVLACRKCTAVGQRRCISGSVFGGTEMTKMCFHHRDHYAKYWINNNATFAFFWAVESAVVCLWRWGHWHASGWVLLPNSEQNRI